MRFSRVCHATTAASRARRGAGERARERIRQVDAAAQAALARTVRRAKAERLVAAAQVSEVPGADGGSTWLLHHAAAPGARIAELRLLPPVPAALGGRFDAGLRGGYDPI